MLDVISQAKNAIEAYNSALRVTSSNLANMNVPGYKKMSVSFQSLFENLVSQGFAAEGNMGGTNPHQRGQGMSLSGTSVDISNGELISGTPLDLAISGQGFFIVSSDGGMNYTYTRNGNFQLDAYGNLLSNNNQVYGLDNSGNVVPIANLPSGNKTDYRWQPDGTLEYTSDGGTTYTPAGYKIAMTYFPNPSGLAQAHGTTFAATLASGSAAAARAPGGSVGYVYPGQVEQSNVIYLAETIYTLELQKAMSGNLSMIRMASDMISSVIQKLG